MRLLRLEKRRKPRLRSFLRQKDISKSFALKTVYAFIQNPLLLFFQIGIGFLSLSVCHQFGINPFGTETSLDHWMMTVGGHRACMMGCGILFISLSLLSAGYFLTIEEINALKRTQFLQTLVLGLISLSLFSLLGAALVMELAGLWLLGGVIGGYIYCRDAEIKKELILQCFSH